MGVAVGGKMRLTTVTEEVGFARRWGRVGRDWLFGGWVAVEEEMRSWWRLGRGIALIKCDEEMRRPDCVATCIRDHG